MFIQFHDKHLYLISASLYVPKLSFWTDYYGKWGNTLKPCGDTDLNWTMINIKIEYVYFDIHIPLYICELLCKNDSQVRFQVKIHVSQINKVTFIWRTPSWQVAPVVLTLVSTLPVWSGQWSWGWGLGESEADLMDSKALVVSGGVRGLIGSEEVKLLGVGLHSQRQILGAGNLPQDSAPVCINIDNSPEMAAHSVQINEAFCDTASDWSIHNVPAWAKGKVPHKYVERGLPAFSPLCLRTRVFVYIGLQSNLQK